MFKNFFYGLIFIFFKTLSSDINVFYNININTNQNQNTTSSKIIFDTPRPVANGIWQDICNNKKILIFFLLSIYFYKNNFIDVQHIYFICKKIAIFGWQTTKNIYRWIWQRDKKNKKNKDNDDKIDDAKEEKK